MAWKRRPSTDAIEILHRRYSEGKPAMLAMFEDERAEDEVARKINEQRTQAGMHQRELAKLVGTTASAICRLEDADYGEHSLAILRRFASKPNNRVAIRFVPVKPANRKLVPA